MSSKIKNTLAKYFKNKFKEMIQEGIVKNLNRTVASKDTNYLEYNNLSLRKRLLARFYYRMWSILEVKPNRKLEKELKLQNTIMQGRIKDTPKTIIDRSGPKILN